MKKIILTLVFCLLFLAIAFIVNFCHQINNGFKEQTIIKSPYIELINDSLRYQVHNTKFYVNKNDDKIACMLLDSSFLIFLDIKYSDMKKMDDIVFSTRDTSKRKDCVVYSSMSLYPEPIIGLTYNNRCENKKPIIHISFKSNSDTIKYNDSLYFKGKYNALSINNSPKYIDFAIDALNYGKYSNNECFDELLINTNENRLQCIMYKNLKHNTDSSYQYLPEIIINSSFKHF